MLDRFFISIFIILAIQSCVIAQETKNGTIKRTKGNLDVAPEAGKEEKKQEKKIYSFSQFGRESLLFVKQPLRWKGKDWLKVGIILSGTALLTLADEPVRKASQSSTSFKNSFPIITGKTYGEWYTIIGLSGAFGVYGLIAHDTMTKKLSIELFQAGLYSEIVVGILKVTVGRARPYLNEGHHSFQPLTIFNPDYNSFPSGHSTSAVALSTVLSRHMPTTILKILIYVPAALTLVSRIYQDKHWVSDELLGAAIGYFVGNWVVNLHQTKQNRINLKVTSINPLGISVNLDDLCRKKHVVPVAN
jgi:membrane-associated phospholipid phosphatase